MSELPNKSCEGGLLDGEKNDEDFVLDELEDLVERLEAANMPRSLIAAVALGWSSALVRDEYGDEIGFKILQSMHDTLKNEARRGLN